MASGSMRTRGPRRVVSGSRIVTPASSARSTRRRCSISSAAARSRRVLTPQASRQSSAPATASTRPPDPARISTRRSGSTPPRPDRRAASEARARSASAREAVDAGVDLADPPLAAPRRSAPRRSGARGPSRRARPVRSRRPPADGRRGTRGRGRRARRRSTSAASVSARSSGVSPERTRTGPSPLRAPAAPAHRVAGAARRILDGEASPPGRRATPRRAPASGAEHDDDARGRKASAASSTESRSVRPPTRWSTFGSVDRIRDPTPAARTMTRAEPPRAARGLPASLRSRQRPVGGEDFVTKEPAAAGRLRRPPPSYDASSS